MSQESKEISYEAIESLWEQVCERFDKKLDSVTNQDASIEVVSGRKIKANLSSETGNRLQLKRTGNKGLFVPPICKLRFGADQTYEFDGSKDVTVPVYMGEINP